MSEQRKIYNTLRVRYNDQLKLFPTSNILSLEDIKKKAIIRFDLTLQQQQFDLEYFEWEAKRLLPVENLSGTNKIDSNIINKLIEEKIELQIVKKQHISLIDIKKKYKNQAYNKSKEEKHQKSDYPEDKSLLNQSPQKHYAQCDKCLSFPIIGIRYKCIICEDYDLCQRCYEQFQTSQREKSHPYMKIRNPVQLIERIKVEFTEQNINKMNSNCKQDQKQIEIIEKDFTILSVSQLSLPHKKVVSKNFVQKLFGQQSASRIRKIDANSDEYKQDLYAIDSCS